jgi:tRNA (cytidine56-2'-O)-methyltransferase
MIAVLRLGHRHGRDARISTHVGLVARVFGAECIIYAGEHDENMMQSVKEIRERWGGEFKVKYEKNWRKVVKQYSKDGFSVVHLTMYGIPLDKEIKALRKKKNVLVVVGGEKVPSEMYQISDYNIAVSNQPHSEVAALAVFLHEYFQGRELGKKFKNAKLRIEPQKRGKKVLKK